MKEKPLIEGKAAVQVIQPDARLVDQLHKWSKEPVVILGLVVIVVTMSGVAMFYLHTKAITKVISDLSRRRQG